MINNNKFLVKFYGVRGSHPVASSKVLKYGGNTSCVFVNVGNHNIILDFGTGIIAPGKQRSNNAFEATILISHYHLDHIMGFHYFQPAFISSTKINIFGPQNFNSDCIDILQNFLNKHFSPVLLEERSASINVNNIKDDQTLLLKNDGNIELVESGCLKLNSDDDTVRINCLKTYSHPKDGVMFYKITWQGKSIVYASDYEGSNDNNLKLVEFAKDADCLIHDAQYTDEDYNSKHFSKIGFGHSTLKVALETAIKANIKKLILFHYDPNYDDNMIDQLETRAKELFPNTIASYEGLELDLFS